MEDIFVFSHENILRQIERAEYRHGYYVLKFYSAEHLPVPYPTEVVSEFYLYPHGGTLRDKDFNLIFYDSRYDMYRGFRPPHLKKR